MSEVPFLYKLLHSVLESKALGKEITTYEFKIICGTAMHVHSSNMRIVIRELERFGLVELDKKSGLVKIL